MDASGVILGKLDICDSQMQGWSESYYLRASETSQARAVFLTLCNYRASSLASKYSLVSGHIEFSVGQRPALPVVDRPLPSPWEEKSLPLLTTLNVAIECRFQTEHGRNINCFFHGLGRAGGRAHFLKSVREPYSTNAIPSHNSLSCPEDGFRAFLAFLRDNTIHARTSKASRVLDMVPWKSVTVKDINLDVELVVSTIERKKEADMLPNMRSLNRCKTLKVVRVGPLQLYFELYRQHLDAPSPIVGFIVDGQAPCVSERAGHRVRTAKYLSFIEPDKSKWLPEPEFSKKWLEASQVLPQMAGTSR